jgi:tRNA 2-thiouridine synthesizing protein B
MLHIVNKSPFQNDSLESCLRLAKKGSTILLTEDAVYAATQGTAWEGKLQKAMGECTVCALGPDLEARGVQGKVLSGVKLVDYGGFVDLVAENASVQSWL